MPYWKMVKMVSEKWDFRKIKCPLFRVHFIKTIDAESSESAERKGVECALLRVQRLMGGNPIQ